MSSPYKHEIIVDGTKIEWQRFSVENQEIKTFTCGNKDLDEFLTTTEVEYYEKQNLGKTYLGYYNHELVAYFTISMSSLAREYETKLSKTGFIWKPEEIPALKIGRLAVAEEHQNKGFGRIIMKYIVGKAVSVGAGMGCRLLVVQAKPEAKDFYTKFGFDYVTQTKKEKKRRSSTMYFDLYKL